MVIYTAARSAEVAHLESGSQSSWLSKVLRSVSVELAEWACSTEEAFPGPGFSRRRQVHRRSVEHEHWLSGMHLQFPLKCSQPCSALRKVTNALINSHEHTLQYRS